MRWSICRRYSQSLAGCSTTRLVLWRVKTKGAVRAREPPRRDAGPQVLRPVGVDQVVAFRFQVAGHDGDVAQRGVQELRARLEGRPSVGSGGQRGRSSQELTLKL